MRHELKRRGRRVLLAAVSLLLVTGCAPAAQYEYYDCTPPPPRAPFTPTETAVVGAYEAVIDETPDAFADCRSPMYVGPRSGPYTLTRARDQLRRLRVAAPPAMEAWPADLGPAITAAADRFERVTTELDDTHADDETVIETLYQLRCETVQDLARASGAHLGSDAVAEQPFERSDLVPLALLIYAEQSRRGDSLPESLWDDSCPYVGYANSPGPGAEVMWPNVFGDMPLILARAAAYCEPRPAERPSRM